ncbi:hypothetical protein GALMADRAFT_256942 [Galerina marginata CBS 339.88]|uniref:Uncharacterized protein n=1 Tax=Galerina marginata (strain CBS 339.88) TaxID=685588 RepID=A0A067SCI4_GALM3|nr:hypothetical protein GALMADRAFT_256942 [Galerina marginata CBS 339.88]
MVRLVRGSRLLWLDRSPLPRDLHFRWVLDTPVLVATQRSVVHVMAMLTFIFRVGLQVIIESCTPGKVVLADWANPLGRMTSTVSAGCSPSLCRHSVLSILGKVPPRSLIFF